MRTTLTGTTSFLWCLIPSFQWSEVLIAGEKAVGWSCLGGASAGEPSWQYKRHEMGFDPWVRKIPWRRAWQTHSSTLAWRIPWTEELGGLQSTGSQRVRHDWANNTHTHTHTILPPERKSCLFNILIHEVEIKFCFHRNLSLFLNLLGWVSFQISYY